MHHLLDFFDRYVRGDRQVLLYDDGFRRWSYTGDQLRATAAAFADRLHSNGLHDGDRLVIWSDNRPEWVAAFWGCMLQGIAVIPLDARASPEQVAGVVAKAGPRGLLVDDGLETPAALQSVFTWRLRDIRWSDASSAPARRASIGPDTIAEIVFTSGTTGEPKGVVITHGNIVANITPIERAAEAYTRYIWLLRPLRFLCLLPLSHMFGQALSIFLPPLVDATSVFVKGYNPDEIARLIRRHRITLAATVPRVLDLLRTRVEQLRPECAHPPPSLQLVQRLWRYRRAHRLFGWKFFGFVVGGAQLDEHLEAFWQRLGFAVIQGYGLTETAPIVTWNDPFRTGHGTVGMPLAGMQVRIAPDGEVLVRGPSVTTGYLNAPAETQAAFEGGWFHTGDLGSFDESGRLVIRGRKKDLIVTSEGLHVVPEEVEHALQSIAGVYEAAAVAHAAGGEHVHAVLVLAPGTDGAAVVRQANASLAGHQRIRGFSIWPNPALPRTDAIRKLKREEIRRWLAEGTSDKRPFAGPVGDLEGILARYGQNQAIGPETTLDELGLTSLDRIELAINLEQQTGVGVSEAAVAESRTIEDLHRAIDRAKTAIPVEEPLTFPRWAHKRLAQMVRTSSQTVWILPLARPFLRLTVDGRQHLATATGPVIFAANHQSHFDVPAILLSMPFGWRRRLSVAMAKEFFDAYFRPARYGIIKRITIGALYYLAVLLFNAFPLPRTGPGALATLRYAGELATAGFSILIFPEGHRTEHGEISRFQQGVGMMASRLRLPVIPVRLEGLDRVLHHTWRWPRRGAVRVVFGAPIELDDNDYAALARKIEDAVVALLPAPVAQTQDTAQMKCA
jgi:long-chain acyl-CoA synthetase